MIPRRLHLKAAEKFLYGGLRLSEIFSGQQFIGQIPPLKTQKLSVKSSAWHAPRMRISFATDFHYGSLGLTELLLSSAKERITRSCPDMILLGGDFLNNSSAYNGCCGDPEELGYELGQLTAPLGVYAVLGNHDWDNDAAAMRRSLEKNGIKVLENDSVPLTHQGYRFRLVGVGDYSSGKQDFREAFSKASADEPIIALAHNPTSIHAMPLNPLMTFSGHTHGGQFELPPVPFLGIIPRYIPECDQSLVHGVEQRDGRQIYISAGLGTSILPWRTIAPEIVIFDLESAAVLPMRQDRVLAVV